MQSFLTRLSAALLGAKVKFAIVGGYAVALHGAVRGTFDTDLILVLTEKNLRAAEKALNGLGLQSRIPVTARELFLFRKEYIAKRNLIAWSFGNSSNPLELVDIVITEDLANMKIHRVTIEGVKVPILAKADLIAMKKRSGRPQDLADVEALERL